MNEYSLTFLAAQDLEEIWDYLAFAAGNMDVADRVLRDIREEINRLTVSPRLGHFRSDLSEKSLRFWRAGSYLIVYQSENRPIEIVRVLHGARDIEALLGG